MPSFPEKLRGLRRWQRLTQKEVADELAVALSTYQRLERGEVEPNRPTLIRLADRFQVKLDYLMRDEPGGDVRYPGEDDQIMDEESTQTYRGPQVRFVGSKDASAPAGTPEEPVYRFRSDRHARDAEKLFFRMMRELGDDMEDADRAAFESFFKKFCEPVTE